MSRTDPQPPATREAPSTRRPASRAAPTIGTPDTVSVIIPCYNAGNFVARAVRSALEQSHRPCEVIVVDDGSTDHTRAVLAQFGSQIRLIAIANAGVANARNVGMRASNGEMIAFLDADDVWQHDKLARQLAAMQAFPGVGLCCCDYLIEYDTGAAAVRHFAQFRQDERIVFDRPLPASALAPLITYNFIGTASNVMLRRAVMHAIGEFDVRYRQAEDYDYWLRCAARTGFMILSACLLQKTAHASNLTNNWLETCLCHESVLLSLRRRLPLQEHASSVALAPPLQPAIADALANVRYAIGNRFFEQGKRSMAFRYYARGLRSRASWANCVRFAMHAGRKLIRLLSFGLLRKRNFTSRRRVGKV